MRPARFPVPILVVALVTGCIAPPSRDSHWRGSGDSAYAESRRRKATATTAVGFGVMGLGVVWGAVGLVNLAAVNADDTLTDTDKKSGKAVFGTFAAIGGAIALVGLIWGAQQADVRGQWSDQIGGRSGYYGAVPGQGPDPVMAHGSSRNGASPVAAECVWLGVETSLPVRGRLFVPQGAPLPSGAEAFEVIRVNGPTDPVAAALAARVPVLRWPVLVLDGSPGQPGRVLAGTHAIAGASVPRSVGLR